MDRIKLFAQQLTQRQGKFDLNTTILSFLMIVLAIAMIILPIYAGYKLFSRKSKFGAIDSPQAQFRIKGSSANIIIVSEKLNAFPLPAQLATVEGYDVDETMGTDIVVTYLGGGAKHEVWSEFGLAENTQTRPFAITKLAAANNEKDVLESLLLPIVLSSAIKIEFRGGKLNPAQAAAFAKTANDLYNNPKYRIDMTYVEDDNVGKLVLYQEPVVKMIYLGGGPREMQSALTVGSLFGFIDRSLITKINMDKIAGEVYTLKNFKLSSMNGGAKNRYRLEWDQPEGDLTEYYTYRLNTMMGGESDVYYKRNTAVKLPKLITESLKGVDDSSDMKKYFIEQPILSSYPAFAPYGLMAITELAKTMFEESKIALKRRIEMDSRYNDSPSPMIEVVTPYKYHPMLAYVVPPKMTFIEKLDTSLDSVYVYMVGQKGIPGRHLLIRIPVYDFLNIISTDSWTKTKATRQVEDTELGLRLESNIQQAIASAIKTIEYTNGLTQDPPTDPCPSCPPEKVCPTPDPCPSCPTFDVTTMCPKPVTCPTFDVASMCPSKPVWPLKASIPTTAKSFIIYYTSSKTPLTFAASLAEAVQMRITFAEKPNANLKIVNKTGYSSGQFGIETINPVTKKAVVNKVTVSTNNIRKGVEDIYAILAPQL